MSEASFTVWMLSGAGSAAVGAVLGAWLPFVLQRRAELIAGIALMKAEIAANIIQIGVFRQSIARHSVPEDPHLSFVPRNVWLHTSGLETVSRVVPSLRPETLRCVLDAYAVLKELDRDLAQHRDIEQAVLQTPVLGEIGTDAQRRKELQAAVRTVSDRLEVRLDAMAPMLIAANDALRTEYLEFKEQGRLW